MNNRFFVPEYSQAVAKLKTEDRVKKLICYVEKDESIIKTLSDHDLNNLLKYLSSSVKEKERILEVKKEELNAAESQMRKICSFPSVRSRVILKKDITELNLSAATFQYLYRSGIHTIDELCKKSREELLKIREIDESMEQEIEQKIAIFGLSLKSSADRKFCDGEVMN